MNEDILFMMARLYRFLMRHRIDGRKIHVIIRADDDETLTLVEQGIKLEWHKEAPLPDDIKNMKVHGLRFSISSLDRSR